MGREEEWKEIPSCPGWLASSLGRICKPATCQAMPRGGYRISEVKPTRGIIDKKSGRYRSSVNGKTRRVAPLVCEAFHGPKPSERHECLHLDEDKQNDESVNLSWGTRKQNLSAPKFREAKRAAFLKNNPRRKLSPADMAEIQGARDTPAKALAERFGVSHFYVYQLWKTSGSTHG